MALDPFVQSKLESISRTYQELTERLGDPDVLENPTKLMQVRRLARSLACVLLGGSDSDVLLVRYVCGSACCR